MVESVRELNNKYKGEWLFLINVKNDEHGNLREGEVLLHSKDKEEVFIYMGKCNTLKARATIRYGGYLPEGFVVEI